MENYRIRIVFFGVLIAFFVLSGLQTCFHILPKNLAGVEVVEPIPVLSLNVWQSGLFQEKFNKWFNQKFGLRPHLTKAYDQILYSLLNEGSPNLGIFIGKEGQLYGRDYMYEYLNLSPPEGSSKLEKLVKDIKKLQDQLGKRGVALTILITPSKPAIYPEYISDELTQIKSKRKRNYDYFVPLLHKYGVNYVDGHQICVDKKGDPKYPLFCKGGLHWNDLAVYYTAKQLIEKIEKQTNMDLVNLNCTKIIVDNKPVGVDKDLANILNVFTTPDTYITPHPEVTGIANGDERMPKTLFIGTSFNWQLLDMLGKNKVFSTLDFYYYYNSKTSYPDLSAKLTPIDRINWDEDVFNKDVIVIEVNENVIPEIGWGFIDDSLAMLSPRDANTKKKTKY